MRKYNIAKCKHIFHYKCTEDAINNNILDCPNCRCDLKTGKKKKVINSNRNINLFNNNIFNNYESNIRYENIQNNIQNNGFWNSAERNNRSEDNRNNSNNENKKSDRLCCIF